MAGAESLNADLPKGLETHQLLVMVVGEVFLPDASTDQLLVWGSREAFLPDESTDQLVSGAPAHAEAPSAQAVCGIHGAAEPKSADR